MKKVYNSEGRNISVTENDAIEFIISKPFAASQLIRREHNGVVKIVYIRGIKSVIFSAEKTSSTRTEEQENVFKALCNNRDENSCISVTVAGQTIKNLSVDYKKENPSIEFRKYLENIYGITITVIEKILNLNKGKI